MIFGILLLCLTLKKLLKKGVVTTADSWHEGHQGHFCTKFACMCFLWVLQFPPPVQKHTLRSFSDFKLALGVSESLKLVALCPAMDQRLVVFSGFALCVL